MSHGLPLSEKRRGGGGGCACLGSARLNVGIQYIHHYMHS